MGHCTLLRPPAVSYRFLRGCGAVVLWAVSLAPFCGLRSLSPPGRTSTATWWAVAETSVRPVAEISTCFGPFPRRADTSWTCGALVPGAVTNMASNPDPALSELSAAERVRQLELELKRLQLRNEALEQEKEAAKEKNRALEQEKKAQRTWDAGPDTGADGTRERTRGRTKRGRTRGRTGRGGAREGGRGGGTRRRTGRDWGREGGRSGECRALASLSFANENSHTCGC